MFQAMRKRILRPTNLHLEDVSVVLESKTRSFPVAAGPHNLYTISSWTMLRLAEVDKDMVRHRELTRWSCSIEGEWRMSGRWWKGV